MSEVVTVHEEKSGWLKMDRWAAAIRIILAILAALGVNTDIATGSLPKTLLPGTLLMTAAVVLVKIFNVLNFKWFNKARKIKIEDNGNAKEITD